MLRTLSRTVRRLALYSMGSEARITPPTGQYFSGLNPGVFGYAIGGLPAKMPSGCSYVAPVVFLVSAIVFFFFCVT